MGGDGVTILSLSANHILRLCPKCKTKLRYPYSTEHVLRSGYTDAQADRSQIYPNKSHFYVSVYHCCQNKDIRGFSALYLVVAYNSYWKWPLIYNTDYHESREKLRRGHKTYRLGIRQYLICLFADIGMMSRAQPRDVHGNKSA